MTELDPFAAFLGVVRGSGVAADRELPPNVERHLPRVQVFGLPGKTTLEAWGGRTLGRVAPFEVFALARTAEEAGDVAREVMRHVEGIQGRLYVRIDTLPHEVTDYNPQVKRYKFTASASYMA
ncbi:head-to-tail connector complex protein [Gordonia phage Catfish]|uniref:Head-to-tail connector complex protein n=1 Tax=Gordonia phage Catfish TaxID=2301538 RepID=A0A385D0I1_9CAUD|nr:head-to-tail connector complex protein [Gordonia phage Catfish]AXQ51852.1 head-to-tail connector complex protein [Gordonia phage Catfish]